MTETLIICLSMLAGEEPLGAVVALQERERQAWAGTLSELTLSVSCLSPWGNGTLLFRLCCPSSPGP